MKLPATQRRLNSEDSLGHGMDAAIMIALFLAAGYGLDRLLGTIPVFMLIMSVTGAVGLFLKFKYRYTERMNEHEAQRRGSRQAALRSADPTGPGGLT